MILQNNVAKEISVETSSNKPFIMRYFLVQFTFSFTNGAVTNKILLIESIFMLLSNTLRGAVEQDLHCVLHSVPALNTQLHFVTYNKPLIQL